MFLIIGPNFLKITPLELLETTQLLYFANMLLLHDTPTNSAGMGTKYFFKIDIKVSIFSIIIYSVKGLSGIEPVCPGKQQSPHIALGAVVCLMVV